MTNRVTMRDKELLKKLEKIKKEVNGEVDFSSEDCGTGTGVPDSGGTGITYYYDFIERW